jgi:hypothetical protein
MTGIWLISYVALWLLVLGGGAVILILAREIEMLHTRLEAVERQRRRAGEVLGEGTPATKEALTGD